MSQITYYKFLSKNLYRHILTLATLDYSICSENCLLCFLALLQFCAYYARFYATPQSIMVVIIQLIQKSADLSHASSCYSGA